MSDLILVRDVRLFDGIISVTFDSEAAFNATQAAKAFGKQPVDWLKTAETKEYIESIAIYFGFDINQLVKVKKGAPSTGGGTWFHPKLAIPFARWLNPKFGVWCDMQIEGIMQQRWAAQLLSPEDQHKIEIYDLLEASDDLEPLETAIKLLGYGRNTGYDKLRKLKILSKSNYPYQQHVDAGRFAIKVATVCSRGRQLRRSGVFVTQKGVHWLAGKLGLVKTLPLLSA